MSQNFRGIVDTLNKIKKDKKNTLHLDGDDITICNGFLNVITTTEFAFNLVFMEELLLNLKPADTIFQKRKIAYRRSMPVLDAVKSSIAEYRRDEKFEEFIAKAQKLLQKEELEEEHPQEALQAAGRTRRRRFYH